MCAVYYWICDSLCNSIVSFIKYFTQPFLETVNGSRVMLYDVKSECLKSNRLFFVCVFVCFVFFKLREVRSCRCSQAALLLVFLHALVFAAMRTSAHARTPRETQLFLSQTHLNERVSDGPLTLSPSRQAFLDDRVTVGLTLPPPPQTGGRQTESQDNKNTESLFRKTDTPESVKDGTAASGLRAGAP